MGVNIQDYRSRIGSFLPNISKSVQNKRLVNCIKNVPCSGWVSVILITAMVFSTMILCQVELLNQQSQLFHSKSSCILEDPYMFSKYPLIVKCLTFMLDISMEISKLKALK